MRSGVGLLMLDPPTHGHMRSLIRVFLLVACAALCGCATTVGTVAGPVSANVSFFAHTHGTPTWLKPIAIPLVAMLGPLIGLINGVQTDLGFVEYGEYGAPGRRPFRSVLDPANPSWGQPVWGRAAMPTPVED